MKNISYELYSQVRDRVWDRMGYRVYSRVWYRVASNL